MTLATVRLSVLIFGGFIVYLAIDRSSWIAVTWIVILALALAFGLPGGSASYRSGKCR